MNSSPGINLEKLAALLRTKRGERGLRSIAEEMGDVSASTLSRIEQGSAPDLPTFMRICSWLGVMPDEFVDPALSLKRREEAKSEIQLPEAIEAQLRQDGVLHTTTVDAISEMIRIAYRAARADVESDKSDGQSE